MSAAESLHADHPRLIVTDALGRRIVPIDKPAFSLGRRSESDLRLSGADISRLHAEIVREGDVCTLHDRQSTFGTFVNDDKIDARQLVPGDRVRLGQSTDRLLASIARHRAAAAGQAQPFLEQLLADVHAFCAGEDPHDDITLLMVRYDGAR